MLHRGSRSAAFLNGKAALGASASGTPIVNPLYRAFLVAVYEGYRDSEK